MTPRYLRSFPWFTICKYKNISKWEFQHYIITRRAPHVEQQLLTHLNHRCLNRTKTDNTMAKRERTNNDIQNTTQKTTDRRWTQVLRKGKQFLSCMWQPSCYSCCKPKVIRLIEGKDRVVITTNRVTTCRKSLTNYIT
jgi:hypothetical protein